MQEINGTVVKRVYHAKKTEYAILKVVNNEHQEGITVKGYFPRVKEGFRLEALCELVHNEKRGDSYDAKKWCAMPPVTDTYAPKYIAGLVGVKKFTLALARKLLAKYGNEVYQALARKDSYLQDRSAWSGDEIRYLDQMQLAWQTETEYQNLINILKEIKPEFAKYTNDIAKFYTDAMENGFIKQLTLSEALSEFPYALCDNDICEFPVVDTIALYMHEPTDIFETYDRCKSGVLYAMQQTIKGEGHVYLTEEQVKKKSYALLERCLQERTTQLHMTKSTVNQTISKLIENEEIKKDLRFGEAYYLPDYYMAECVIAKKLSQMKSLEQSDIEIPVDIGSIENELRFTLGEKQKEAIKSAVNSRVSIITGGPGTGKTTIIRGIVMALQQAGLCDIYLAAPTGRAALRIKEATGHEATTIHRMLKITVDMPSAVVKPFDSDAVIVDEASMIDIDLMQKLVRGLNLPTRLIIVGDENQLPSVGPGLVLKNLIESKKFNTVKLDEVYRQAQDSAIVANAYKVLNGEMIEPIDDGNFHFHKTESQKEASDIILWLKAKEIREKYGFVDDEIQVLSPLKDGDAGTKTLNKKIQDVMNPHGEPFPIDDDQEIRVGDRAMHLVNDYTNNVFNGEIGRASAIVDKEDDDKALVVDYDEDRKVEYCEDNSNMDAVTLAYAITVHKSQGSEYKAVVIPIFQSRNMYRNLLYTGMTRAKEQLFFVGDPEALQKGIMEIRPVQRNTKLLERILASKAVAYEETEDDEENEDE